MSENLEWTSELSVRPKKIKDVKGRFQVIINNKGDIADTYRLKACDSDGMCSYGFAADTVAADAGAAISIPLIVRPKRTRIAGAPKSCVFTVTAVKNSGGVITSEGRLECMPLITVWGLALCGIVALVVIVLMILFLNGGNDLQTDNPTDISTAATPTTLPASRSPITSPASTPTRSPITSPASTPITSPITSPASSPSANPTPAITPTQISATPTPARPISIFHGSLAGTWSAQLKETPPVPISGTFLVTIDLYGDISGTFTGDYSGTITGRVDLDGNLDAVGTASESTTSNVTSWQGKIIISGKDLSTQGALYSESLSAGAFTGNGATAQ